jgi:hypothetical protein
MESNQEKTPSIEIPKVINHQRQKAWQIWLPIGLFTALIVFIAVLVVIGTGKNMEFGTRWSSLSVIYLLIPILLMGIMLLAITFGIVYGLAKLLKIMPIYTWKVKTFVDQIMSSINHAADKSVQPILGIEGFFASAKKLFELPFRSRKKN